MGFYAGRVDLEKMLEINAQGHWQGEVVDFGWNNRQGFTEFVADNGCDFLANVLQKPDLYISAFILKTAVV